MKVLAATVDWIMQYDNDPQLKVLVDRWPSSDEFVYDTYCGKKVADTKAALVRSNRLNVPVSTVAGQFYYGEKDGAVSFYARGNDKQGFGGRKFNLRLRDGTTEQLVGPYSSSPTTMASLGFPWSMDVTVTDDPEVWERGYTFFAGNLTIAKAQEAAALAGVELEGPDENAPVYPLPFSSSLSSEQNAAVAVGELATCWRVKGKRERYNKVRIECEPDLARLTRRSEFGPDLYLLERHNDFKQREWVQALQDGTYVAVKNPAWNGKVKQTISGPFRMEVVGGVWPLQSK